MEIQNKASKSLFPLWEHKAEVIAQILRRFDFEKVHAYMRKRRWRYAKGSRQYLPSVACLRKTALGLMSEHTWSEHSTCNQATGGFCWAYYPNWCSLQFNDGSWLLDQGKIGQNRVKEFAITVERTDVGRPAIATLQFKRGGYTVTLGNAGLHRPTPTGGKHRPYTKREAELIRAFLEANVDRIQTVGRLW